MTSQNGRAWMEDLNEAQRAAVLHPGGALLIVAGAGSGKTKTLACRVAQLVDQGVPPERILLLTFTRRAAREMLARAGRLSDPKAAGRVWGGTFHAVANRLLRMFSPAINLSPDFTVMDQGDSADLMGFVRAELDLASGARRFPKKETLASIYSRMVNSGTSLGDILEHDFPWCAEAIDGIRAAFRAYTERKRDQQVLDYDDLLLFWKVLAGSQSAGEAMDDLFDHILVDEYQDTNALQAEILGNIRRRNGNLTVVGDDAQAIYSFRSATARNILDFPTQFRGATVITLEQNYRSTVPILEVSNAVMAQARERHTKNLWSARRGGETPVLLTCLDEQQQCEEVCDNVLEHRERGIALRDQAVLFRAGWHSDMLEVELSRRGIPFVKYGGIRFLESAHVKDVMALLRILDNPFDEIAWWRVLQLLPGVGPATVRRLMDELHVRVSARADGPALTPLQRLLTAPPEVPSAARDEFGELRSALEDCAFRSPDGAEIPPASQVERARGFCEKVWYHKYESPGSRLHDIEQLEQTASNFSTRSDFVSELMLDPPHSTEDLAGPPTLDDDYLILSTIHSAKGCEWNVVHVLHASDGMIPSDMALKDDDGLEEERRLLYVAMTRAKDMLYVYFPLRYYHRRGALGDSHSYAQLSRFLTEAVRTRFEQQVAGVVAPVRQATVGSPAGVGPVDSYLEELWGG